MLALQGGAHGAGARRSAAAPIVSSQPRQDLRCYDVLGVSRFATPVEIRHAYRHKALNLHPDKLQGQLGSFLSLAEAFEILSDATQRGAYDRELAACKSRDGMSGVEGPALNTPWLHRDCIILCMALLEMVPDEWLKHLADVPTPTLKEMQDHLLDAVRRPGASVRRMRPEAADNHGNDREEVATSSKPRHLCKNRGYYCAQIQMCGVHVRTFCTRHMTTAAEAHLALVSLKETFFAKWKENGMADFDEVLRAAAVDARAQKMYFPGALHWFEKAVEPEPGLKWRLTTPCTRDLETTMRNRSEVLQLLNRGATKRALQASIDRMRENERATKAAWEEMRPCMEERLLGFISCELDHRLEDNGGFPMRKRRRLRGKQSVTQLRVQLPWFGRFAADHGISATELEALLPPLQTRLRGVPSLEQCLQRALRNSLVASGQHPGALEDDARRRVGNGAIVPAKRRANAEHAAAGGAGKDEQMAPLPLPPSRQAEQQAKLQQEQQQEPAEPAQQRPQGEAPEPPQAEQPSQQWPRQEAPQQQQAQQWSHQQEARQQEQEQHQQRQPQQPPPQAQRRHTKQPPQPQQLRPHKSQPPQTQHPPRRGSGHRRTQEEAEAADGGALGAEGPPAPRAAAGRSASPTRIRDVSPARPRSHSPVPRPQSRSQRARRGWRECYSFVLQELLADPEVDRLFGQPVDLEMYPDYLDKIAPNAPVDLRLILHRLNSEDSGYSAVDQCSADVSMVWENAARFNAPGSYVRAIAEQAAKIIDDLLQGRRSAGRIWCRAPSPGHRSSLRPETRSRSETRARSQLSVQFGNESSVPKMPTAHDSWLGE
mmetsp:Transcript_26049/g.82694  ORF Transcript_26049/g.82694 Transcript_26049/m.82694 type:complete len:827 (+) Transcript_26049:113-2593(+)